MSPLHVLPLLAGVVILFIAAVLLRDWIASLYVTIARRLRDAR